MTVHRWFANKACPGDYLYKRHGQIASEVNSKLTGVPYKVKVDITDLNIRKGPGTSYPKTGKCTGKGVFTIIKEQNGWGKLKSGLGWISLKYTTKL